MQTIPDRRSLPEALQPDARDVRLPRTPPRGFRNMLYAAEAPEEARWTGSGCSSRTEPMLQALAARMVAAPPAPAQARPPAGYTYLAQFVAHDLKFSTDEREYPPCEVATPPLSRRRLTLESIYGEGPWSQPALYGQGVDALAPFRLRLRAMRPARRGPAPIRPRLHPEDPDRWRGDPGLLADARNAGNPVAAAIADLFKRLHNRAVDRLPHDDPAARFRAARRVAVACYRRIAFADLAPRLTRPDVCALWLAHPPVDRHAQDAEDAPSEFTHAVLRAGHALVRPDYALGPAVNDGAPVNLRAMLRYAPARDPEGWRDGWPFVIDWRGFFGDAAQLAEPLRPHVNVFFAAAPEIMGRDRPGGLDERMNLVLLDLTRGMEGGVQKVGALADALAPRLSRAAGACDWLCLDPAARRQAVLSWARAVGGLDAHAEALAADPPLYLFVLIEAAAPAAQGGGGGARLGALGSALLLDPLRAFFCATRAHIEDHPDLAADRRATFGPAGAPDDMLALARLLAPPA